MSTQASFGATVYPSIVLSPSHQQQQLSTSNSKILRTDLCTTGMTLLGVLLIAILTPTGDADIYNIIAKLSTRRITSRYQISTADTKVSYQTEKLKCSSTLQTQQCHSMAIVNKIIHKYRLIFHSFAFNLKLFVSV